jgi:hypothetical protein
MVHPLLGQVTTQPSQPSQKKTQSFSEHVSNYVDYFQSESCLGRKYSPYEQVALSISRLYPIWKEATQRKYKQVVPHGGPCQLLPLECNLEMISITLSQWCTAERLEHPHTKASNTTPAHIFEVGPPIEDFTNDTPCTIQLGTTTIDMVTVDRTLKNIVCYIDRKPRNDTMYPKCTACSPQVTPLISATRLSITASPRP